MLLGATNSVISELRNAQLRSQGKWPLSVFILITRSWFQSSYWVHLSSDRTTFVRLNHWNSHFYKQKFIKCWQFHIIWPAHFIRSGHKDIYLPLILQCGPKIAVSTLPLDPTEMLWGPGTPFHARETAHTCILQEKTLESQNSNYLISPLVGLLVVGFLCVSKPSFVN